MAKMDSQIAMEVVENDEEATKQEEEEESFQDAFLRHESTSVRASLVKALSGVREAYTTPMGTIPPALAEFFEKSLDPARLDRLSKFAAENRYKESVHAQYFSFEEKECQDNLAFISAGMGEKRDLCAVCERTAREISEFLLEFEKGDLMIDEFWPPRLRQRDLFIDGQRWIPPEFVATGDPLPSNVIQHRSAKELVISAENCSFCELLRIACILDSFREKGEKFDHSREPLARVLKGIREGKGSVLFNKISGELSNSNEPVYLMLWKGLEGHHNTRAKAYVLNHIQVVWERPPSCLTEKERKTVYTRLKVHSSPRLCPSLAPYISSQGPLQSSDSPEAFEQMRTWVKKCRDDHLACTKTISGEEVHRDELHKLPHRLLDTGPPVTDTEPRLIDTTGLPDGQWVALSHCWGDSEHQPLKTTKANLSSHLTGIPISDLPKTFRDAITVTKELGLRYIWIDSLCIVQDDEEDWLHESQLMGTIYERAVLTIAASSAENSTQGLFLRRLYADLKPLSVKLPFFHRHQDLLQRVDSAEEYSIFIQWPQEPFTHAIDPLASTLATRGWATQEWNLSRRTLHFLSHGIIYICNSIAEDETGSCLVGRDLPRKNHAAKWSQIIQEHSRRKFTFQRDRLISLEGLAKIYRSFEGRKDSWYAYGTWGSEMPEALLWAPKMYGTTLKDVPSWSWAACQYEIWFRIRDIKGEDCKLFLKASNVLSVDIESGGLKVKGKMKEIQGYFNRKFDDTDAYVDLKHRAQHWDGHYVTFGDEEPCGWALLDQGDQSVLRKEPRQTIYFLLLAVVFFEAEPQFELYGLLLTQASEGKEGYTRIGVAALNDVNWLAEEEKVEVEIF